MLTRDTKPLLSSTRPKRASFRSLFDHFKCYDYFILLIGIFLAILYGILPAFLTLKLGEIFQQLSDHTESDIYSQEMYIALTMIILGITGFFIGILSVVIFSYLGSRNSLLYRNRLFKRLINKPVWWYDTHKAENLSSTINRDLEVLESATGEKLMVIIYSIAMCISGWVLAFVICTPLALLALGQVPIFILARYVIYNANKDPNASEMYRESKEICDESLQGIKTVAALNAEDVVSSKFQQKTDNCVYGECKDGLCQGIGWAIYYVGLFMFQGFVLYTGAWLIKKDQENWITGTDITIEAVIVIFFAGIFGNSAIFNIPPALQTINSARIIHYRILPILKENFDEGGPLDTHHIQGEIHFINLTLTYPTSPEKIVLQNFNLYIPARSTVAILGEKGSGKTSIFNLLLRFYEPRSGSILLDNLELSDYNIYSLRKIIGVMNKEPILFKGTIRENIQFGCNSTYEDVVKSAKMTESHEFITSFDQGYETQVENGNIELSREEKQKICFSRLFLKKPKILLIDEATADLDHKTQQEIENILDFMRHDKTTLIITDRISQAKQADQIIVLSQNMISEHGTHEELLSRQGYYFNLYNLQLNKSIEIDPPVVYRRIEGTSHQEKVTKFEVYKRSVAEMMRYKKWVVLGSIAGLVTGGLFPVFGYVLANNIYDIIRNQDLNDIKINLTWLLLESLVLLLSILILIASLTRISSLITSHMRKSAFSSVLYYDMKFHEDPKYSSSKLSHMINKDTAAMSTIGGSTLAIATLMLSCMTISFIIGYQYSIPLASLAGFFLPFTLLIYYKVNFASVNRFVKLSYDKGNEIMVDALSKIRTIQTMNGQARISHTYSELCKEYYDKFRIQSFRTGMWFGSLILVLYLSYGISAWFGAYLIKEGEISYDDFVICIITVLFGTWSGMLIVSIAPNYSESFHSARKIYSLLDNTHTVSSIHHNSSQAVTEGNIELIGVYLRYRTQEYALQGVSFKIHHGMSVGILGKEAAGKSSICNLLMRFYDCTEGSILLNGINIQNYSLTTLRSCISICYKQPFFFSGSIKYNLQLARQDITDSDIEKVLRTVKLEAYVKNSEIINRTLDKSPLYSNPEEMQKLAIARALLRPSCILLLDEAISTLPPDSAVSIIQDLKSSKRTLIVLSSDAFHLQSLDSVFELNQGKITNYSL